jgi:anti-sigma factor RsiW
MTAGAAGLTCRELVELVTEYLEGALPASERARFDQHLAACAGCRAHLEQVRLTIELAGRLTEETIPPAARDALLEAFRGWSRPGRP